MGILVIILATTIPGFFVGFLKQGKGNGTRAVGLGSFLAVWMGFAYWVPEMFSSIGMDTLGFILKIELIIIGMIILSFIVGVIGMLCGALGEDIAFSIRKKVCKKRI